MEGDNQEESESRYISAETKRIVRQRCGFGCVLCGLPIIEYHHIERWADTYSNEPDNITLLCSNCHTDHHHGIVTIDQVKEANSNPYNIKNGESAPKLLRYAGNSCRVTVAGNYFEPRAGQMGDGDEFVPLIIDTVPIIAFHFSNGILLLNVDIYDEENNCCLRIEDNELVFSTGIWDVTFIGNVLQLNEAARKILLKMEILPPNEIRITGGKILLNGVELTINDSLIVNTGEKPIKGTTFRHSLVRGKYGLWITKRFERLVPSAMRSNVDSRKPYKNHRQGLILILYDNFVPILTEDICSGCLETVNALQLRNKGDTARCPLCDAEYMKGNYWVKDKNGIVMNERWQESNRPAYCHPCALVIKIKDSNYMDGDQFPNRCPQCGAPLYSRLGEE